MVPAPQPEQAGLVVSVPILEQTVMEVCVPKLEQAGLWPLFQTGGGRAGGACPRTGAGRAVFLFLNWSIVLKVCLSKLEQAGLVPVPKLEQGRLVVPVP